MKVRHAFAGALGVCVLCCGAAPLRTQSMLFNLSDDPAVEGSSHPHGFLGAGGFVYFWVTDLRGDIALYRTDGTAKRTLPLLLYEYRQLKTYVRTSPFDRHWGTSLGNVFLFAGYHPAYGWELFRSDGTRRGTRFVKELTPGSTYVNYTHPRGFIRFGNRVCFVAGGANQNTLWISDGTPAGTVRLLQGNELRILGVAGKRLLFLNAGNVLTAGLWASDGTVQGTRRIAAYMNLPGVTLYGRDSRDTAAVNGRLLFAAAAPLSSDYELWASDGTAAGTRLLRDIRPGPAPSEPKGFTKLGTKVLFAADDGVHGRELWVSDGTARGTKLLADLDPRKDSGGKPLSGDPRAFTHHAGAVYFAASHPSLGREVWVSDGTPAGTKLAADIVPGAGGSRPRVLASAGTTLFVVTEASKQRKGSLLALSAGSPQARYLAPISTPAHWSFEAVALGSRLVFGNEDTAHGFEPWTSDGTLGGTGVLVNIAGPVRKPFGSVIRPAGAIGDTIHFSIWAYAAGMYFVSTDGTRAGTKLRLGPMPGPTDGRLVELGDRLLSWDAYDTKGLYAYDKTTDRETLLAPLGDWRPGYRLSIVQGRWRDRFLYRGYSPASGIEPWITDGTPRGTRLFADLVPGAGSSNPHLLAPIDARSILVLADPDGRTPRRIVLLRTDGTRRGTIELAALPGKPNWLPHTLALERAGKTFFLFFEDAAGKAELWRTDGTKAGTSFVRSFADGPLGSEAALAGTRVVFRAAGTSKEQHEVWVSDGTPSGTHVLIDPGSGKLDAEPTSFVALKGRVLFVATSPATGREVYVSDGTPTGTRLLVDALPGPGSGVPPGGTIYPLGSRGAVFVADDGLHGYQIWQTDGTRAGTRRVTSGLPAAVGAFPPHSSNEVAFRPFYRSGTLLFGWYHPSFGREPWVWSPGAVAYPHGRACSSELGLPALSGTDPVLGKTVSLTCRTLGSRPLGLLLIGFQATVPLRLPGGCFLYADPGRGLLVAPFAGSGGRAVVKAPVPAAPSLQGLVLEAQALQPTPAGPALSNPLELTLGF